MNFHETAGSHRRHVRQQLPAQLSSLSLALHPLSDVVSTAYWLIQQQSHADTILGPYLPPKNMDPPFDIPMDVDLNSPFDEDEDEDLESEDEHDQEENDAEKPESDDDLLHAPPAEVERRLLSEVHLSVYQQLS